MPSSGLPRILVSNDDGVAAPGLRALVKELHAAAFCEFAVSGPSGERSAQSHCITVGKHLHAFDIPIEGAAEAYAVDGSPADSVMLALHGPLLNNPRFDLVVSGINRGDNCGLHVIYSGTVGAAREAACKDVPSLAVSLDSHGARTEEQYRVAATYTISLVKAVLGVLPDVVPRPLLSLRGVVLNVNIPAAMEASELKGLRLCYQGQHCSFPDFQEMSEIDPHFSTANGRVSHELTMGEVKLRAFRNRAGYLRTDERQGSDSWAVQEGWVAVTLVGLVSDIPLTETAAQERLNEKALKAAEVALKAAAKDLSTEVAGLP